MLRLPPVEDTCECAVCCDVRVPPERLCRKGHAVCATCLARVGREDCVLCLPYETVAVPAPPAPVAESPQQGPTVANPRRAPGSGCTARGVLREAALWLASLALAGVGTACAVLFLAYLGKGTVWLCVHGAGGEDPAWFTWTPWRLLLVDVVAGTMALCGAAACGNACRVLCRRLVAASR